MGRSVRSFAKTLLKLTWCFGTQIPCFSSDPAPLGVVPPGGFGSFPHERLENEAEGVSHPTPPAKEDRRWTGRDLGEGR